MVLQHEEEASREAGQVRGNEFRIGGRSWALGSEAFD